MGSGAFKLIGSIAKVAKSFGDGGGLKVLATFATTMRTYQFRLVRQGKLFNQSNILKHNKSLAGNEVDGAVAVKCAALL